MQIYLSTKNTNLTLYLFPWKIQSWISFNSECFLIFTDPSRTISKWLIWLSLPFIQQDISGAVWWIEGRIKTGGKEPDWTAVAVKLMKHYLKQWGNVRREIGEMSKKENRQDLAWVWEVPKKGSKISLVF